MKYIQIIFILLCLSGCSNIRSIAQSATYNDIEDWERADPHSIYVYANCEGFYTPETYVDYTYSVKIDMFKVSNLGRVYYHALANENVKFGIKPSEFVYSKYFEGIRCKDMNQIVELQRAVNRMGKTLDIEHVPASSISKVRKY